MDNITLKRIETAHPAVREELRNIYNEICAALTGRAICRFAYVIRTFAEQDELFAIGRTKPGKKVTDARAGQSYHNYGLAVDIVLILDGKVASWETGKDFDADSKADWMEIVAIFKKYGWFWGGDFKKLVDRPHFEKSFGFGVSDLLARHRAKNFIPGTTYVNLK